MKIGLIDTDSKTPNLALMKISQYHKQQGHKVNILSGYMCPPEPITDHDPVYPVIVDVLAVHGDKYNERTKEIKGKQNE